MTGSGGGVKSAAGPHKSCLAKQMTADIFSVHRATRMEEHEPSQLLLGLPGPAIESFLQHVLQSSNNVLQMYQACKETRDLVLHHAPQITLRPSNSQLARRQTMLKPLSSRSAGVALTLDVSAVDEASIVETLSGEGAGAIACVKQLRVQVRNPAGHCVTCGGHAVFVASMHAMQRVVAEPGTHCPCRRKHSRASAPPTTQSPAPSAAATPLALAAHFGWTMAHGPH
jgi:hypothetical protein